MSFLHIYFIAAVLVLLLILKMTMPAVFSNTLYSQKSLLLQWKPKNISPISFISVYV